METEGTTSQPLGNDVLGALMAQVEARNDAIRSELDAMRGEISTFSGRLGQRLLSRGQTPQIQRSYTSPNPKTPTQTCPQPKPIPSHQTTLNQIPFIQVEKEKKMQSKESESKHQVGEKMNSEVQEECEERREKERDATGSEKEKEYLIVDLVHKGPLLFTNPNASTLPSIDSSHVQVQDYRILEEKSKEVPFKTLAENPNFGISDEEVSPKGNLGIFPCNVEHEGCHDAKPSDEHTSYDLQGNKAILCTYRNLNYCDVASSGQSGVVSDLLGVEVYGSSFCDTLGVDRLYKEQTLFVSTQALVDPLDDKINSFCKNDLCPSSDSTYNLNKVPLSCDKNIHKLHNPLVDDSTLGDVFTLDSYLYYLFDYDDNFELILCRGSKLGGCFPFLNEDDCGFDSLVKGMANIGLDSCIFLPFDPGILLGWGRL
ncbi:uncharacterized protein LOC107860413 isoform X1 [Capsicum annuum]|uniref:uncharacterized protein LOC107860413 isoform X1 n=1 Tax=Capsicum annuum TaxID=4072 RepID=UPI001FB08339|nr:uncharacterized protein LOC107860413 isoform X1 [Capsicum annuum]XP_047263449.1 uncharacterized protein LOC107860413 isoform X1 [Capsicum annuum]XP_047263450.1 uncharacterized protein LOC107860413 isoform X1 [Capsicum annuum]XP_047263451.1 uncharacterized protein LOC107860413 isoform X1 [Capsicum annuum]